MVIWHSFRDPEARVNLERGLCLQNLFQKTGWALVDTLSVTCPSVGPYLPINIHADPISTHASGIYDCLVVWEWHLSVSPVGLN